MFTISNLISISSCKNELFAIFFYRNQHVFPLFSDAGILPVQFSYYKLTVNLMLTFDTEMHLEIFETCFTTFLIFTPRGAFA